MTFKRISKKIAILAGILLVVLIGITTCTVTSNDVEETQSPPVNSSQPTLTPQPTLTVTKTDLSETTSIATEPPIVSTLVPSATPGLSETASSDAYPYPPPTPVATTSLSEMAAMDTLNPTALIRVAFVRDGRIYLYEDGEEKLVAEPAQPTTEQACFHLFYPFLSPDGQYLAYIEQVGTQPDEFGGCSTGFLRIVDSSTGINQPTSYRIRSFRWTADNLLNFTPEREIQQTPQQYTIRNIYFDPSSQQETVFETIIDQDESTGAETMFSAEYPADDLSKLIRYKDNQYYLVERATNEETLLFDTTQVASFLDWSPGGQYAIFESVGPPAEGPEASGLAVDTQNPGATPQEITVSSKIGAGGPPSTGRKWYFERGFVEYCRERLYFIDGSQPLQLTDDEEKGGCHNEEGFVATSPSGEYAFVKFTDRFELHTKDGNKTIIEETEPLAKSRGAPANLIWVNDDYLIIFESTYGYPDAEPIVYLFDRQANVINPLIENAYLIKTVP